MDAQLSRPPLRRPTDDRMLAGVCAGIARTLGIEPVIVRVVVAVLAVLGGSGFALYLIGWLLIPADDTGTSVIGDPKRSGVGKAVLITIAVLAGLSALGIDIGDNRWGFFEILFLALITLGAYQWWNSRQPGTWQSGTTPAPPAAHTPVVQPAGEPPVEADAATAGPAAPTPAPSPPPPPAPPSALRGVLFGIAVIAVGALWLADVAGWYQADATRVLAIAIAIVGTGLVIGAFTGRARWLIAIAVPLIVFAHLSANVSHGVDASIGDRTWQPAVVADVTAPFSLGVGDATLDLSNLPPLELAGRTVSASLGVGTLTVLIPADAAATVTTRVGLGTSRIGDVAIEGSGLNRTAVLGDPSFPTFTLDLEVGVGTIVVDTAMIPVGTVVS